MAALIAVVGNSGAGKTSLVRTLAARGGYVPVLEEHAERPFQQAFAHDLRRYALTNQVDYLLFRAEQELALRRQPAVGIVDGGLDLDFYGFTQLFRDKGYLDDAEYALCARHYRLLRALMPGPDLYICLHAPLEVVARRFAQRNRTLEITARQDLAMLDALIETWMAAIPAARRLVVDASQDDFLAPPAVAALQNAIEVRLLRPGGES